MGVQESEQELQKLQVELARFLTSSGPVSNSEQLYGISLKEIELNRDTLYRKRLSQTKFWMPKTAAVLGIAFEVNFREFAISHHFNGHKAIALEAIGFAEWLAARTEYLPEDRPWIGELACWETLDCRWHQGAFFIRLFRFHYDFSRSNQFSEPPKRVQNWICVRCFSWYRMIRLSM